MKIIPTSIPDVLIIEPTLFGDERGFFLESFNQRAFEKQTGVHLPFVQDNHSRSAKNVLRGLHYQIRQPQGKLVRVTVGEVFDVCVDLRQSSPSFGQSVSVLLSADNHRQLWIPPGFAHGFLVLSEVADFLYKTTDYYSQKDERCLLWGDSEIGIKWPIDSTPTLTEKDLHGLRLSDADLYE